MSIDAYAFSYGDINDIKEFRQSIQERLGENADCRLPTADCKNEK